MLSTGRKRDVDASVTKEVPELARFLGLEAWLDRGAGSLPHGYRKLLGIGLALATRPTLILMDEPTAGMSETETEMVTDLLRRIRETDVTIAVVEHDMKLIMNVCDRIVVLNYGEVIATGSPAEVGADPKVDRGISRRRPCRLLDIQNASVRYGQVSALHDASLAIGAGEIVALIGSNGAGKSSLLRAVMELVPLTAGSITFDGRTISGAETASIVRQGITLSPEGRRVFPVSVEENLLVGGFTSPKSKLNTSMELIFELLPALKDRRRQLAGTLSGGEHQMMPFGRALMARPKLMLLDEPSLGLAPLIVREIGEIVVRLNRELDDARVRSA